MNKINTYTNNIVIHLFEGEKITKTAHISATQIQKHQGKVISFLLDKYQPTAFEMRLEKDTTSDYPRYYFGEACLCDPTGIPQVICKGKPYPLKKNDFVFDPLTMKCTYGKTRLVSVSTYLPKSLTNKNIPSLQRS